MNLKKLEVRLENIEKLVDVSWFKVDDIIEQMNSELYQGTESNRSRYKFENCEIIFSTINQDQVNDNFKIVTEVCSQDKYNWRGQYKMIQ